MHVTWRFSLKPLRLQNRRLGIWNHPLSADSWSTPLLTLRYWGNVGKKYPNPNHNWSTQTIIKSWTQRIYRKMSGCKSLFKNHFSRNEKHSIYEKSTGKKHANLFLDRSQVHPLLSFEPTKWRLLKRAFHSFIEKLGSSTIQSFKPKLKGKNQ